MNLKDLRFILRDGKRILQSWDGTMFYRAGVDKEVPLWQDIPLCDEETGEEIIN